MDINKIFSSFTSDDDNIVAIDFTEHPIYLLGMFKKLILNHKIFKSKNLFLLKSLDPDMNINDAEIIGDFVMFNRAWHYIKDVNPLNETHKQIIESSFSTNLIDSIDSAISYFENKEEYEKCAHIFNIKKILIDYYK